MESCQSKASPLVTNHKVSLISCLVERFYQEKGIENLLIRLEWLISQMIGSVIVTTSGDLNCHSWRNIVKF